MALKVKSIRYCGELLDEVGDGTTLSDKDAIDYLLSAAIDRFGYSGRDVFTAVFEYQVITGRYMKAFNIELEDLKNAASSLWSNEVTARMSHALSSLCMNDEWNVNFKSQWVAENGESWHCRPDQIPPTNRPLP